MVRSTAKVAAVGNTDASAIALETIAQWEDQHSRLRAMIKRNKEQIQANRETIATVNYYLLQISGKGGRHA